MNRNTGCRSSWGISYGDIKFLIKPFACTIIIKIEMLFSTQPSVKFHSMNFLHVRKCKIKYMRSYTIIQHHNTCILNFKYATIMIRHFIKHRIFWVKFNSCLLCFVFLNQHVYCILCYRDGRTGRNFSYTIWHAISCLPLMFTGQQCKEIDYFSLLYSLLLKNYLTVKLTLHSHQCQLFIQTGKIVCIHKYKLHIDKKIDIDKRFAICISQDIYQLCSVYLF